MGDMGTLEFKQNDFMHFKLYDSLGYSDDAYNMVENEYKLLVDPNFKLPNRTPKCLNDTVVQLFEKQKSNKIQLSWKIQYLYNLKFQNKSNTTGNKYSYVCLEQSNGITIGNIACAIMNTSYHLMDTMRNIMMLNNTCRSILFSDLDSDLRQCSKELSIWRISVVPLKYFMCSWYILEQTNPYGEGNYENYLWNIWGLPIPDSGELMSINNLMFMFSYNNGYIGDDSRPLAQTGGLLTTGNVSQSGSMLKFVER